MSEWAAVTEKQPKVNQRVFGYDDNQQEKYSEWLEGDWRSVRIGRVVTNSVFNALPVPHISIRYEGDSAILPLTHWQPVPEPINTKES